MDQNDNPFFSRCEPPRVPDPVPIPSPPEPEPVRLPPGTGRLPPGTRRNSHPEADPGTYEPGDFDDRWGYDFGPVYPVEHGLGVGAMAHYSDVVALTLENGEVELCRFDRMSPIPKNFHSAAVRVFIPAAW